MAGRGGLGVAVVFFALTGMALAVLGWWLPPDWRARVAVVHLIGWPLAVVGIIVLRIIIEVAAMRRADLGWRAPPARRRTWEHTLPTLRVEASTDRFEQDVVL